MCGAKPNAGIRGEISPAKHPLQLESVLGLRRIAEALIQHLAGIFLDTERVDGNSPSATHSLAVNADDT